MPHLPEYDVGATPGREVAPHVLINALTVRDGGGRAYIVNVLRELDADPRGFRFTVLTGEGQISPQESRGLAVRTVRLPQRNRALQLAYRVALEQAWLPLWSRRFDLLYCVADMAPLVSGRPTVVALRNLNIYDDRFYQTARLRALRRLVPRGLRHARRVVFPSHAAADEIKPRLALSDERSAVVYHGIAPEAFTSRPATAVKRAGYLFLPAALERHKNVEVLIEGLACTNDPHLELWIAGQSSTDPEYAAELRTLVASRHLGNRVRFLGPVAYQEIIDYYRGALALVFPSIIETFGHPLLEAMLTDTPIVASDIPAFREIAGDVAHFFPTHDASALARCIVAVRSDPAERDRRAAIGRERAAHFSWKSSVDALCHVFRDVLREGAG